MKKCILRLSMMLLCTVLAQPLGVTAESISTEIMEIGTDELIEEESFRVETIEESENEVETVSQTEVESELECVNETEELLEAAGGVEGFVDRLYSEVLGRKASASEKANWINLLKTKQMSGAEVAQGFVDSNELKARKLGDSAYIDMLYKTFMNRSADTAGKKNWQDILDKGMSRMFVFKGFAESDEFTNICNSYGITRGNANLTEARDQNMGVTTFVVRCYNVFLGRKPDTQGLNEWCERLLTGQINAKEAAYGFVMSTEFQNKGLNDTDYIKTLYLGFFNRTADSEGLNQWKEVLSRGCSRETLFYGFADSQEFRNLAAGFGLDSLWQSTPVFYRSKEEIKEKVLEHYYNAYLASSDPKGCYAIFDSETNETSSEYRFMMRYQMSDERAAEMINSGRFPSANQLVGMVTVNKKTGKVTLDIDSSIWWLW